MVGDNRSREEQLAEADRMASYSRKTEVAEKAPPIPMPDIAFTVVIPGSCASYAHDIRRFIDAMVFKLEKNVHKGRWEDLSVQEAFQRLMDEVEELQSEIGGNTMKIVMEAADVANFAMIIASIAIERNR